MKKKTIVFVQNVEYPQQGAVDMFYYSKYLSRYPDIHVIVITAKINENISHENLEIIELGKINYFLFILKAFFRLKKIHKTKKIDYVHFFAQHPLSVLLQFFTKYILRIKTIYDVVSGPIGKGLISKISYISIKTGIYVSDFYILDHKKLYNVLNLKNTKKFEVIGIGYDREKFYENKKISLLKKSEEDIIFTYIGTLNTERNLDVFLQAFIHNLKIHKDIKLYFIGSGTGEEKLKKISKKYRDKNIFFLGKCEHNKIPNYINSSDILISYVPKIEYFEYQPPTKLIEYLACNKPVMVTNTIAQEEIMGEMKQCIHGDSYEETKEKIKYLADNFSQFNNLNLSSLVEEYSWDKLTSKIYNEIQK